MLKTIMLGSVFSAAFLNSVMASGVPASCTFVEIGFGMQNAQSSVRGNDFSLQNWENLVRTLGNLPAATLNKTVLVDTRSGSSKNKSGFLSALNVGMLYRPENSALCVGFTVGGALGGGNSSASYNLYRTNNNGVVSMNKNMMLSIRDRGHLKMAFRIGAAIGNVMPFIQIGWATHRLSLRMGNAHAISKWDQRLVLGLGVDYNISQNLILGLLAEIHKGHTRTFYKVPLPQNTFVAGNPRIQNNSALVMATVKYAFPRNPK